jgi:hypothetical protein
MEPGLSPTRNHARRFSTASLISSSTTRLKTRRSKQRFGTGEIDEEEADEGSDESLMDPDFPNLSPISPNSSMPYDYYAHENYYTLGVRHHPLHSPLSTIISSIPSYWTPSPPPPVHLTQAHRSSPPSFASVHSQDSPTGTTRGDTPFPNPTQHRAQQRPTDRLTSPYTPDLYPLQCPRAISSASFSSLDLCGRSRFNVKEEFVETINCDFNDASTTVSLHHSSSSSSAFSLYKPTPIDPLRLSTSTFGISNSGPFLPEPGVWMASRQSLEVRIESCQVEESRSEHDEIEIGHRERLIYSSGKGIDSKGSLIKEENKFNGLIARSSFSDGAVLSYGRIMID